MFPKHSVEKLTWSRREFLKLSGLAVGAAALPAQWAQAAEDEGEARWIEVLRPGDMFVGRFRFLNCGWNKNRNAPGGYTLVRLSESEPALIIFELPPQHIAEDGQLADKEPGPDYPREFAKPVKVDGPLLTRMAGPSQLVYLFSEEDFAGGGFPFSLAEILRRISLRPLVVRTPGLSIAQRDDARTAPAAEPSTQPVVEQSQIEWPFRLFISPYPDARFFHLGQPQPIVRTYQGADWQWEELWHTGLDLRRPDEREAKPAPVISLSVPPRPDANAKKEIEEGPVPAEQDPRGLLQTLAVRKRKTGDLDIFPPNWVDLEKLDRQLKAHDGVLRAKQMILTSLGASGDVEYRAQVNQPGSLRIWTQRSAIGRDNYIRVITNGYLMPFQHSAVFVQIWERKLARTYAGPDPVKEKVETLPTAALLLRHQFIVVLQPEKNLPVDDVTEHLAADRLAREQAFSWVRIKDPRTPDLVRDQAMNGGRRVFWPVPQAAEKPADDGGKPFRFRCEGRDRAGRLVEFEMPFLYAEDLEAGREKYDQAPADWRTAILPSQAFAFASESAAPFTLAEVNEKLVEAMGGLLDAPRRTLTETPADSVREVGKLLFGSINPSQIQNLKAALQYSGQTEIERQTLIGARLEELLGGNDLAPAKLRRTISEQLLRLAPSELAVEQYVRKASQGDPPPNPVEEENLASIVAGKLAEFYESSPLAAADARAEDFRAKCLVVQETLRRARWELQTARIKIEEENKNDSKLKDEIVAKKERLLASASAGIRQAVESLVSEIVLRFERQLGRVLDQDLPAEADARQLADRAADFVRRFSLALSVKCRDWSKCKKLAGFEQLQKAAGELNEEALRFTDRVGHLAGEWVSKRTQFLQALGAHLDLLKNAQAGALDQLSLKPLVDELAALIPEVRQLQTALKVGQIKPEEAARELAAKKNELLGRVAQLPSAIRVKQVLLGAALKASVGEELTRAPDPALLVREIQFQINQTVSKLGSTGLHTVEQFLPRMQTALVEIPAIKRVEPDKALARIEAFEAYVDHGFARFTKGVLSGVRNGIYAQFAAPLDRVGGEIKAGVVRPVLQFAGLSREVGPVIGNGLASLNQIASPAKADLKRLREEAAKFVEALEDKPRPGNLRVELEKLLPKEEIEEWVDAAKAARKRLNDLSGDIELKRKIVAENRELLRKAVESAVDEKVLKAREEWQTAKGELDKLEREAYAKIEELDQLHRKVLEKLSGTATALLEKGLKLIAGDLEQAREIVRTIQQGYGELGNQLKAAADKLTGDVKKAAINLAERAKAEQESLKTLLEQFRKEAQAGLREKLETLRVEIDSKKRALESATGEAAEKLRKELNELEQKIAPYRTTANNLLEQAAQAVHAFEEFRRQLQTINPEEILKRIREQLEAKAKEAVRQAAEKAKRWVGDQINQLNIKSWLPDVRLLGSLQLSELLETIGDFSKLPKILAREFPDRLETSWHWSTALKKQNFKIIEFEPDGRKMFELNSRTTAWLPTAERAQVRPPESLVHGNVDRFRVILAECILLNFTQGLEFDSGTNRSTKVNLKDFKVSFQGALAFVNTLQTLLEGLLGNRVQIRIVGASVQVGVSLPIPPISFGAFSLSNLSLNTWLRIPFGQGVMKYGFSFCESDNRFLLSVAGFAGGGFLTLGMDSDGGRLVEGALEFGGALELNVVIASGKVEVMGGIYFRFTRELSAGSGYLRVAGHVMVLGWIDVGVEVVLGLWFQKSGSESYFAGYARVRVSVKIGFFSQSFEFQIEKKFAGSKSQGGDNARTIRRPSRGFEDRGPLFASASSGLLPAGLATDAGSVLPASHPKGFSVGRNVREQAEPKLDLSGGLRINRKQWRRYCAAFSPN